MEYEIDDDPQGECDRTDADRTGGVREDHIVRPRCDEARERRRRETQPG